MLFSVSTCVDRRRDESGRFQGVVTDSESGKGFRVQDRGHKRYRDQDLLKVSVLLPLLNEVKL